MTVLSEKTAHTFGAARPPSPKNRPIGIDLFCGAGGMSLGFEMAGFHVAAAVESDPVHARTHALNFPNCCTIEADVATVTGASIRDSAGLSNDVIDVVFGGPPCQGFSLIGRRDADDPRNALLLQFARVVAELDVTYFVLENVPGIAMGHGSKMLLRFKEAMKDHGYAIREPVCILDAADFGVPQRRRRLFVLGAKSNAPIPQYPSVGIDDVVRPSVWDAISDLASIDRVRCLEDGVYSGPLGSATEYSTGLRAPRNGTSEIDPAQPHQVECGISGCGVSNHTPAVIERFKQTVPGSIEPISRFHRLHKSGLCNTLRAGSGSTHGSYTAPRPIHPTEPRCITVREAARIHSFPDWFQFDKTIWHGFRQVGNAVPPRLAGAVATAIAQSVMLDSR